MSIFKERYRLTAAALALISAGALIQGCADPTPPVDCVNVAANADARKTGFDAGYAQGMALTNDNGKTDGYPGGRSRGANDGYNGPNGYPKGYSIGLQQGRAQGQADAITCSDASIAGSSDGYASGIARGRHDGYTDGYNLGLDAGYNVGQYTCGGSGDAASDQNVCKSQGRDAGYLQAKNVDNKAYQSGLAEGAQIGYNDGLAAGQAQGLADGKAKGQLDGFEKGRAEAYVACYNAAYTNGAQDQNGRVSGGKVNGFNDGYFAYINGRPDSASLPMSSGVRPVAPSVQNGLGGEGDGFHDGVLDAHLAFCPNAQFNNIDPLLFYAHGSKSNTDNGKLLPWFTPGDAQNPIYDIYTESHSAYMSQSESTQVEATIQQQRAADKAALPH